MTERATALLANVSVNVVANLLAVAFIYLSGAAIGLFPRDLEAIVYTLLLVALIAGYAVTFAGLSQRVRIRGWLLCAVFIIFSAYFALVGLTGISANGTWQRWVSGTVAIICLTFSALMVRLELREHARQKQASRIKGLHWIELP
ncbi:hypothetical protein [Actinoplanes sp. NPDC049599]|uniref:hypothetical protein n=1 Tax=Actinoplanes sp. NPDC049599 TaxID=3363903 RepID=UPI00379EE165